MNKRIAWSLGVGLVGLYLAQKQTYWLQGTFLRDIRTCTIATLGCAAAGFFLGCIVEKTRDERSRRIKLFYWMLVMGIFGSFVAFGKGVPVSQALIVMAWSLGIGLGLGLLQYFLAAPKTVAQ